MSSSDFFKKLQPLFESADKPNSVKKEDTEKQVVEGADEMARKYQEFLAESSNEIAEFDDRDDWQRAVEQAGLEFSPWGHGSASAHNDSGKVIGEWVDKFDCNYGERPHGWLTLDQSLGEEIVTELSPMLKKRVSDKRIEHFQNATDDWEASQSDPNLHAVDDEDNPFSQNVEQTFNRLQRNHRLAVKK